MAILSLDPEDPITSPHLPPVMELLHEQIVKVSKQNLFYRLVIVNCMGLQLMHIINVNYGLSL